VKDEYTFDFLELGEEHSERALERALLARIEDFLREMGGMFAFMGSQYRLEVDQREYFIIEKQLPQDLQGQLPTPEQISRLLEQL